MLNDHLPDAHLWSSLILTYDAFSQVLKAGASWRATAQVNCSVNLGLIVMLIVVVMVTVMMLIVVMMVTVTKKSSDGDGDYYDPD